MLKSSYHNKELQLIGRPFTSSFINFLTKECYWSIVLWKNSAYSDHKCITLHLEHLIEVRQCQNWSSAQLLLDQGKALFCLLFPGESPLLQILSDKGYYATKISNKPLIEGCQLMEASHITHCLWVWLFSDYTDHVLINMNLIHTDHIP